MSAIYCPHAIVPVLDRALVSYRVATVSRIDETIGLFGRILSVLWGSLAKETYNLWILLTKATPYDYPTSSCTLYYIPHVWTRHERVSARPRTSCFIVVRWLRLVGSLKLYFSFAKEPYQRDDILQKRPMILRSLLIVATPYELLSYTICEYT